MWVSSVNYIPKLSYQQERESSNHTAAFPLTGTNQNYHHCDYCQWASCLDKKRDKTTLHGIVEWYNQWYSKSKQHKYWQLFPQNKWEDNSWKMICISILLHKSLSLNLYTVAYHYRFFNWISVSDYGFENQGWCTQPWKAAYLLQVTSSIYGEQRLHEYPCWEGNCSHQEPYGLRIFWVYKVRIKTPTCPYWNIG